MPVVVDTHVHLYPVHDADRLFVGALNRLRRLAGGRGECALVFTERHDCHAFRDLREGRLKLASFTMKPAGPDGLCLRRSETEALYVVAGRQVAARERLEILALGTDADLPDGEPIRETILRVREAGGLPVLAWAPGKWLFSRANIVAALLEEARPGSLLVGDTALRPTLWPTPDLMSYSSLKGLKVIAGSDPLPVAGEEDLAGTYASYFDAPFDSAKPAARLRHLLTDPTIRPVSLGRRGSVFQVWRRLQTYKKSRSAAT